MTATLNGFVIGLIFVSLVVGGFMIFAGTGAVNYGVEFSNESMKDYNKITELNSNVLLLENQTSDIGASQDSENDVVGSVFASGYRAATTQKKSFSVFQSMLETSIRVIGLDTNYVNLIYSAIWTIVIFTIISILIYYAIKVWP